MTYIILGVALAVAINIGMGLFLSTDMPVVAVESNSMVPTFSKGDILVLQGISSEDTAVGDIIVFSVKEQTTPVVHRVISINDDGTFKTRGDANSGSLSFETSIDASQIHGKSIMIIPYLGWVKIGLTEIFLPNILFFIIVIAVSGMIFYNKDKIMKKFA
ncbi:MAG: signal peptidase I [Nanoarchaeota archaeon]